MRFEFDDSLRRFHLKSLAILVLGSAFSKACGAGKSCVRVPLMGLALRFCQKDFLGTQRARKDFSGPKISNKRRPSSENKPRSGFFPTHTARKKKLHPKLTLPSHPFLPSRHCRPRRSNENIPQDILRLISLGKDRLCV